MTKCLVSLAMSAIALVASASLVVAQTGVSDDRVSLPEGPGSLEGIGDNASINANMGAMAWSVPIELPNGHTGMTPGLSIDYSSSSGNGIVGMGWSLALPNIERLTIRGIPEYLPDDEFAANGGDQLVLTETLPSGDQVYRARFEGAFIRYTWHNVGTGDAGYWRAELPDGRINYYGARADGTLESGARVDGPDGTFRYNLVETVDPYGHRVEYTWFVDGTTSLLAEIGYVFAATGDARYRVSFDYEDRIEWMSDATPGFEEVTSKRLHQIDVIVSGTTIRSYALTYESHALSGGLSRLSNVTRSGVDGSPHPIRFDFTYALTLGQLCDGTGGCERPFVETIEYTDGNALDLGSGTSTLLDINGDGLPDLLQTSASASAPHKFYINQLAADGSQSFAPGVDSTQGFQDGHDLSVATVQVLDVDGDGFTDLANTLTGQVLLNRGGGDWDSNTNLFSDNGLAADMNADFSAGELQTLRFMDYDNDRLVDVIKSSGSDASNVTTIYRNLGAGGFVIDGNAAALGAGFDSDTLELNDFNGDGLLDAVQVQSTQVRYRLNLGWGAWGEWRTVPLDAALSNQEAIDAELEDVNGDALTDLVLVSGGTIRLWINENAQSFAAERSITSADVSGTIPVQGANTTVLFADMNGNGSSDVVWFDPGVDPVYLDLYPVPANLLTRIENGIGMVIDVDYASSVEHMARDAEAGSPWAHALPFPNIVVERTIRSDAFTGVASVTDYSYRDGFYDGVEKSFRGYVGSEILTQGDANHESGQVVQTWDVGVADPYRNGRLLTTNLTSGGRSISLETNVWSECPISGVPSSGLLFAVRHICLSEQTTVVREGLAEADWLTLRTESDYDGYGNLTLLSEHGVDGEPGDERYTETEYVSPADNADGRWILGLPFRTRTYGATGSTEYSETLTYYDGPAFEGLPLGEASVGFLSRETERVDSAGTVIEALRRRADAHGNPVEEIEPDGVPGGDGDRRLIEYDEHGLRVTALDLVNSDSEGEYRLRSEVRYDSLFDLANYATSWRVMENGTAASDVGVETRTYDAHGRLASITSRGDSSTLPTQTFTYDFGPTVARIVTRWRSESGGEQDLEIVNCVDGRGRAFQTRTKVGDDDYLVSDYALYGVIGKPLEEFQPYSASTGACDMAPPTDIASTRWQYDALGRVVVIEVDDESGTVATQRMEYRPLETWTYDFDDESAGHPHEDTPNVVLSDGLGQTIAVGRTLTRGVAPESYTFEYSETGDLTRIVDPLGNARVQEFDLAGRITRVTDPDRGIVSYVLNDSGLVTAATDATGVTVRTEYDGLGRVVEEWVDGQRETTLVQIVYDRSPDCPPGFCDFAGSQRIATHYPGEVSGARWSDWLEHDAAGQLTGFSRDLGLGTTLDIVSRYDNVGRLRERVYPGERTVTFELDGANRATTIPGYVDAIAFDARGDLTSIDFANGVVSTQSLDTRRRQVSSELTSASNRPIVSVDLSYDVVGRIVDINESTADGVLPSDTATYTYDAFGRIARVALDQGAAGTESIDYGYDAADNLVSRTSSLASSPVNDGTRAFDAASPRRLLSLGDMTFDYDATGALIRRGTTDLTWDGMGRLRELSDNGIVSSRNIYAASQDRVQSYSDSRSTYFLDPEFLVEDGVASFTVNLGGTAVARHTYVDLATDVLSDLNGDSAIDAADGWLAFAMDSGILADDGSERSSSDWLLSSSARQAVVANGDEIVWLHRNHGQNVTAVTNEAGESIERSHRYPFGAERGSTSTMPERQSFSNQPTADLMPDFVAFGSRYYDPIAARWISPDFVFETITTDDLSAPWEALGNYLYVSNSPTRFHDPTGGEGIPYTPAQAAYVADLFTKTQSPTFQPAGAYTVPNVLDALSSMGLAKRGEVLDLDLKKFVADVVLAHQDELLESLRDSVLKADTDAALVDAVQVLNEFTISLMSNGSVTYSNALVKSGDVASNNEQGKLESRRLRNQVKAAKAIRKRVNTRVKKDNKAKLKAEKKRIKQFEIEGAGAKSKVKVTVTAN